MSVANRRGTPVIATALTAARDLTRAPAGTAARAVASGASWAGAQACAPPLQAAATTGGPGLPVAAQPLAVRCRGVAFAYPAGRGATYAALAATDLDVHPGEFLAVIGPSGCGKSTLLRLLAGLLRPASGTLTLDGPAGASLSPRPGLAALMPQRDCLLPWRRLLDNVALGAELGGLPRASARQAASDGLAAFGLAPFAAAYPGQLSGGMRQRAALLRTALAAKGVLLLDEPLGALDSLTRAELQEWLESLWLSAGAARPTVVLVTHDVAEAVQLADRVVVMSSRPGRVVAVHPLAAPRPRAAAFRTSPEAVALQARLLADLRAGVAGTVAADGARGAPADG